MRKIKNKIHPNIINHMINLIFTLPLNLLVKSLYPRVYRLDDLIHENEDEEKVFTNLNSLMLDWIIKSIP
jgi:hypothetical protein